jgi:hypothetical protein
MDSKKLNEVISKVQDYLDNVVQEGISVVRYLDESMDSDGVKVDQSLIIQEIDGDLILERIIEIPSTRFDPGDTMYEELAVTSSIEEMLPIIKSVLEEEQEEREALSWLDYENDIESEEEEDEDDF